MALSKYTGNYTKAFLSTDVSPSNSIEHTYYNNLIEVGENEACYIYSFKENKLIFTKQIDALFGIPKESLNMVLLNSIFEKDFNLFFKEFHDRLLLYLYNNKDHIQSFSCSYITRIKKFKFPILVNLKFLKTDDSGNLVSIIGRIKRHENLKTTKVIQYSLNGDFEEKFTNRINFGIDHSLCISEKNINLLEILESDKSLDKASETLSITKEEISRRISQLNDRYDLKSLDELLEFSKANFLIPNQFKIFNL